MLDVSTNFMTLSFKYFVLFILLFLVYPSFGQTDQNSLDSKISGYSKKMFWDSLPNPKGWTNDYENIYSAKEESYLDSIITAFKNEKTIEIAIVTIDTSLISTDSLEDLTLHIANVWKIGEKGKDNGILIGISKGHRKMRIEYGFGIESLISDDETKEIIETAFIPRFKEGQYYQGTINGINKLIDLLRSRLR